MRPVVSVASIRWSLSIVFVICLSATLLVSIQGRDNDERLEAALKTQVTAVAQIKDTTHDLCAAISTTAHESNAILDSLISVTRANQVVSPAFKAATIAKYQAIKVKIVPCN